MQWLLHGGLTGAVADILRKREDVVHDAAEIGLAPDAPAEEVLRAAEMRQYDLITGDHAVAMAPFTVGIVFHRSLVLLHVGAGDVEQDDAVERLFTRYKRLAPGRLYTVTGGRVKIRQLPTRRPAKD